MKKGEMRMLLA